MDQINWGIIGCGDVTEVKSGPAFYKAENSSLKAVMRRNGKLAEDYAQRHQVPRWYTDAESLINDSEVNAVYIAAPPLFHEEYTIQALKAGKPVYVEKPMGLSAASAQKMLQAAQDNNAKLSIAHYRREMPLYKAVKTLLDNKTIGRVRLVNMQLLQPHRSDITVETKDNWRLDPAISGGGLFHDLAPHLLDLMIHFFGNIESASGISLNQAGCYKADDLVSGRILFQNKVLFQGLWSFTVPAQDTRDSCEIIGSEGSISFPLFGNHYILNKNGETVSIEFAPLQHVQQPMIQQVVNYFLDKSPNPCPPKDGVKVMQLMDTFTGKL